MSMVKQELELWISHKPYRRKKTDEAYLYDKYCPVCKRPEMIGLWKWSELKYTSSRCSSFECNYGQNNNG